MKSLSPKILLVLVAITVTLLTSCGVSQSKHQEAIKELEKIKSILAEQQKTLQEIQSEEKTIDRKNVEIKRLRHLEDSTFDDAEAHFNAHDNTNALITFNAFARDFPESHKIELAQERIKQIKQIVAHEKWIADAPIRAAQARAAAALAQAQAQQAAQAEAIAEAQEEGRLRAQYQVQAPAQNYSAISTTGTVRGFGNSKGDAYAAARQNLPVGAVELKTHYSPITQGSDHYFNCTITYQSR